MKKQEVVNFLEKIKVYYPSFTINDMVRHEWIGKLESYDYEDCCNKLDEYLDGEYNKEPPKPNWIIKYLKTTEEKARKIDYKIQCQLCGKILQPEEYEKHYKRCCSAKTIVSDLKKYYNQDVDYNNLMAMNDELFEKAYVRYLNKMIDVEELPDFRKNIILKCLYPQMDIEIKDVLKNMEV